MMTDLLYASAYNWWVVWCAGLCVVWGLVYAYRYVCRAQKLAGYHAWLIRGYSAVATYAKMVCFTGALLCMAYALLQPRWGKSEHKEMQEGRELFIALDISRSMLAQDIQPNRLAFARAKIKQLLKQLPAERVALVVFSGSALVYCPLTTDREAFLMFLDNVDAETISAGSTALAGVIKKVLDQCAAMETRKNKLMVIFTDGEDFSGALETVQARAQQE